MLWDAFARMVTSCLWLFLECHGGEFVGMVAYCVWFQHAQRQEGLWTRRLTS